jgi:hypothetical protein
VIGNTLLVIGGLPTGFLAYVCGLGSSYRLFGVFGGFGEGLSLLIP